MKSKKTYQNQRFNIHFGVGFLVEFIILLSFFLFAKKPFDDILGLIVDTLFKPSSFGLPTTIAWITLVVLTFSGFVIPEIRPKWGFPSFRQAPKTSISLIAIALIYFFLYRSSTHWQYYGFGSIYYADLVVLFAGLNTLSWIKYITYRSKTKSNDGFIEDLPYLNQQDSPEFRDLFLFEKYATNIATEIAKTFPKQSFTIGINGPWGSGKTSFMHMIAEKVCKQDPNIILLKFNAWESSHANKIIPDFLDELKRKVGIMDNYLAKLLSQYGSKFSALDRTGFMTSIQSFLHFKSPAFSELKDQISQTLLNSGKRMLILVDDLDRLNTQELIEVFNLIRNSISFSNVIFMMAYDRGYLDTAMKGHTDYSADRFLEKIVNAEYSLPLIFTAVLKYELKTKLKEEIEKTKLNTDIQKNFISEIFEAIDYSNISQEKDYFSNFLTNKRDVTRLVNSIKVNLAALYGEVLFRDFLHLELLKLKKPTIHYKLQNSNNFLKSEPGISEYYYVVKPLEEIKEKGIEIDDNTYQLLGKIFPSRSILNYDDRNKLSIRYPKNYHLYFRYFLESSDFSEMEFKKFMADDIGSFKHQIKKWVLHGFERYLSNRFEMEWNGSFNNIDHFKNVFEATFYLASLPSEVDSFYFVGIRNTYLRYQLQDYNNSLSSQLGWTRPALKEYIQQQLMKDADDWNWTKSDLVDKMKELTQNSNLGKVEWLFSCDELVKINLHYLKKATEQMTPKSYNRLINVLMHKSIDSKANQIDRRAIELVLNYSMENNITDQLFMSFIGRRMVVGADYSTATYHLMTDWKHFFKSEAELISAIETSKMSFSEEVIRFVKHWINDVSDKTSSVNYPFSEPFMQHLDNCWARFDELPNKLENSEEQ